jgi:hypothetical protein
MAIMERLDQQHLRTQHQLRHLVVFTVQAAAAVAHNILAAIDI